MRDGEMNCFNIQYEENEERWHLICIVLCKIIKDGKPFEISMIKNYAVKCNIRAKLTIYLKQTDFPRHWDMYEISVWIFTTLC